MRKWTVSKITALAGVVAGTLAVSPARAYYITTYALIAYKAFHRLEVLTIPGALHRTYG